MLVVELVLIYSVAEGRSLGAGKKRRVLVRKDVNWKGDKGYIGGGGGGGGMGDGEYLACFTAADSMVLSVVEP